MLPITLKATSVGSIAAQELFNGSSHVIGEVTHTFSNSFYLRTTSGELVFFSSRPSRSPITVNLDATSRLDDFVRRRDQLYVRGKEVQVRDEIGIDLSEAAVYSSELTFTSQLDPRFRRMGNALNLASFVLGLIDTRQSALDAKSFAHEGVVNFARDGMFSLRQEDNAKQFREAAFKIVGLGTGFTPSGDDVLGGFLAEYNSLAHAIGRTAIRLDVTDLERKTSWVSTKLLDYMQRLVLDDQIDHVIRSAASGHADAFILALESLFPRGHASGIDISVGIVLALSIIRDIALHKDETERIVHTLLF